MSCLVAIHLIGDNGLFTAGSECCLAWEQLGDLVPEEVDYVNKESDLIDIFQS